MYTDQRIFDRISHDHFARISRDYNPIHMDATAARRTQSGTQIVHGIHSLLWLLERFSQSELFVPGITSLRAQFLQPIYVGDEATLEISASPPKAVRARILVGGEEVLAASMGFDEASISSPTIRTANSLCMMPPVSPNDLSLEEMEHLNGCLSLGLSSPHISSMFPTAVQALGIHRVAALACSSCLVGMIVPGLHSMFSGLSISFCDENADPREELHFMVKSVAKRFRLVRIAIKGPGLFGSLETLSRMPPVSQPCMDRVKTFVSNNEFHDATALIIGGSRGLGELTAKLVAAGGARVIITYAMGKTDADAVIAEMKRAGSVCAALAYDVHRPAADQLACLDMIPTHVYYFATPPIFRRKTGLFDVRRFTEFNTFYVTAFFDLVQTCLSLRPRGLRVFYPSSVAIENRTATMTEYSMSKAAAEVLCTDLSKFVPGVHVQTCRLPRLPTDQTNSVVQTETKDPIAVMLPIVREMHRQ